MWEQIEAFLTYLTTEKDCSENTTSAYKNDLTQFIDIISGHVGDWRAVDNPVLTAYVNHLQGKKYASSTVARKVAAVKSDRVYSPYVGRDYPDQVLFGDTHFHTNLSFDAGLVGTSLDVDAGYRFARGEKVLSNSGQPAQLIRPLDFLVITDHAEFIGLAPMIQQSDPALLADPWGKWVYERFNAGPEGRMEAFGNIIEWGTVKLQNPFS